MSNPLQNRTVAIAEGRQLEDLAQLLEKEGASVLRYPLVSILDSPDPTPVNHWLRDLVAGHFDMVVLLTGEGLHRLLSFAERINQRNEVIRALGQARTLTRGPKPARALKEVGLASTIIAQSPTTEGAIATLRKEILQGKTIGVQLYGEPNPLLVNFLVDAGATVRTVSPYIYAPASDGERTAELIDRMAQKSVDVLVFTSSPQVERLFDVAKERGSEKQLREGLALTRIAAVGPVIADKLRGKGIRVTICPDQGFVMKNLIQHIKRNLAEL